MRANTENQRPGDRRISSPMNHQHETPVRQKNAPASKATGRSFAEVVHSRQVFWENVLRDMLTGMSMELGRARAELDRTAGEGAPTGVPMYNGSLAIVTVHGSRIPVADVQPMLACSLGTTPHERALSADVQCTIFQVRTPAGEIFTLPLHQIASIQVLSPELFEQLQGSQTGEGPGENRPFGYRAFTSLARDGQVDNGQQTDSDNGSSGYKE